MKDKKETVEKNLYYADGHFDIHDLGRALWRGENSENFPLPQKKHQVILLVNGLNQNLLDKLSADHVYQKMIHTTLYSVVPTTEINTAISFFRGMTPSVHGILGDYRYDKERNISYTYTLFEDRSFNRPLSIYGLTYDTLYQFPQMEWNKGRKYHVFVPNSLLLLECYRKLFSPLHVHSYHDYKDVLRHVLRFSKTKIKPTTSVLYITEFENMCNDGASDAELISWFTALLETVTEMKRANCDVIVTSLHGGIRPDASIVLNYTKYNKYFYALPSTSNRMTSFHIKDEYLEEFQREFKKDYTGLLELYKIDDLIDRGVFENNEIVRSYGEFFAIPIDRNYLELPVSENDYIDDLYRSDFLNYVTGGMSREEVVLPYILITEKEEKS